MIQTENISSNHIIYNLILEWQMILKKSWIHATFETIHSVEIMAIYSPHTVLTKISRNQRFSEKLGKQLISRNNFTV